MGEVDQAEVDAPELPAERRRPGGPALRAAIARFHATLEGIRELVELVSPHLDEDGGFLSRHFDAMTRRQSRAALIWMMWSNNITPPDDLLRRRDEPSDDRSDTGEHETDSAPETRSVASAGESEPSASDPQSIETHAAASDTPLTDTHEDDPPLTDAELDEWDQIVRDLREGQLDVETLETMLHREFQNDGQLFADFAYDSERMFVSPDKRDLLNESLLVTAVSAFEVLLGRILSVQFHRFPGLLDASDKRFTLSDLQSFETIDDARNVAIRERVESLMRQSFEDWESWFAHKCKIEVADHCIERDVLHEVIHRRHLVVHTGGVVSSQYLEKVRVEDGPALGAHLIVDGEYLERALDELDVAGIALGTVAAISWDPDDAERAVEELQALVYRLLQAGRYAAVKALARSGCSTGAADAETELILRVNGWIADSELYGPEAIRHEVSAWDVSALEPRFRLASVVLLRELDAAFEMIPRLIEIGQISEADLQHWPLLRPVRDDQRFASLLSGVQQPPAGTQEEPAGTDELTPRS
jgi:hypothetical protein